MVHYKKMLNYIGLLRIYSFLDILIFATVLTDNVFTIIALGFLWYSGIFFNEWIQKDALRERVSAFVHILLFIPPLFALPLWLTVLFMGCTLLYGSKKRHAFFAVTAPFWRGMHNSLLAFAFVPALIPLAFILTVIRNIIGDFRDAGYDYAKGIHTLPVIFGITRNQNWAFFAHMGAIIGTTVVWGYYSFLSQELLMVIVMIEFMTYPLTPRASAPEWINIYSENISVSQYKAAFSEPVNVKDSEPQKISVNHQNEVVHH